MNDLPGMLQLSVNVQKQVWPHTIDAQCWVDKWMETIKEHPEVANDPGTMIGWFANAIMAGYDTAQQRMQITGDTPKTKE